MEKLEIKIMLWTGVMLAIFLMALMYASAQKNIDVPECVPYNASFLNPQVKQRDSTTYEAFVVAKMWGFQPAEIYLPVGCDLDLYLASGDVVHGMNIEKKGINMMAVPGAIAKQTLHFDKPGIYKMVCHEYCGTGHANMQAEIIVNYKR